MPMECPADKLKPSVFPCPVRVHCIVRLFSLRPPAELYPMMVSNGINPPLQVNVCVKLSVISKVVGKGDIPGLNLDGIDESTLQGKPPVRKLNNYESAHLYTCTVGI